LDQHQPVQPCVWSPGCPGVRISKLGPRWSFELPRFPHPSERLALKPRGPALPVAPLDEVASCPAPCILRLCRRPSFRLPRLSCPLTLPRVELQVAPLFTLSVLSPDASPRFPRLSHLPALPATDLRVASNFASFSTSGALAWGFPRSLAPPVAPADALCRVAPVPASSGFAGDRSASHLAARILWRPWRWCFGLPLGLALPVTPPGEVADCSALFTFRLCLGFESSGCPSVSLLRRRLMVPRVASVPAPSGLPSLRLQVSLNPASTAGSMMTSRFSSNFASSAGPRMNLRVESDRTDSRLTLDALSISLRRTYMGEPT
jgi:hypothetical protein